jgi:hypothetical protein
MGQDKMPHHSAVHNVVDDTARQFELLTAKRVTARNRPEPLSASTARNFSAQANGLGTSHNP